MGSAAILLNCTEPCEQIVNILLTEGPMWKVMKAVKAVSEKKTFKDFMILYIYIAKWQGQINSFTPVIICC